MQGSSWRYSRVIGEASQLLGPREPGIPPPKGSAGQVPTVDTAL